MHLNPNVKAFLDDIWSQVTPIYEKESKRIRKLKNQSRLQAGIKDYMKLLAWMR